jgi:hypothetical protein
MVKYCFRSEFYFPCPTGKTVIFSFDSGGRGYPLFAVEDDRGLSEILTRAEGLFHKELPIY